ncbi:hypothetical protein [uncultured Aquimarina sp.]|uniref:hypothetical protein n=1 Tax=uncultured Aquimarina sp. TaxID=575652 RepID=UPI00263A0940|nr:hypothetical protein [uncultured Aquimarina sp.]
MSLLISCSEGDLITLSVDFDEDLQNCANENDNTFVFFVIDQDINRSLSVNFTDTSFEINPLVLADISLDEPTIITLNTTNNQLLYREFNTPINGEEYFCSSIPISNINVTLELISTNGTAEISYEAADNQPDPTQTIYTRTVILRDVTLEGDDIAIRKQILELGSDSIIIPN